MVADFNRNLDGNFSNSFSEYVINTTDCTLAEMPVCLPTPLSLSALSVLGSG